MAAWRTCILVLAFFVAGSVAPATALAEAQPVSIGWALRGQPADSSDVAGDEEPVLIVFWSRACPHCAAEWEFLATVAAAYPEIEIEHHEVSAPAGRRLFVETMEALGLEARGVPTTILGDRVWVGFDASTGEEIRAAVERALEPAGSATEGGEPAPAALPLPEGAEDAPLALTTVLIALVDGLNPCSLWVLSILLALVLRTGSRRRTMVIGGTFLLVTAVLYALYIAGMYGALAVVAAQGWVRVVMAAVALGFGVISLAEYARPGGRVSLGIPGGRRPALYRRMRAVTVEERPLPAVLAGTVVLAVGVSLLETPCTAGYPLLWADLLAEQQVGPAAAVPLFLLYLLVFLVDELVVFTAALVTMRAMKLEERAGRVLRLVGGLVMVVLAATLIVAPEAMTTVGGSMGVFGVALALMAAVLVGERMLDRRGRPSRRLGHP